MAKTKREQQLDNILGFTPAKTALSSREQQLDSMLGLAPVSGVQTGEFPQEVQPERPSAFLPTGEGLTVSQRRAKGKQLVSETVRGITEPGGAVLGATLAIPAAVAAGPFAPAVEAAAGGLGFAGGKALADFTDELLGIKDSKTAIEEIKELPLEVIEGMTLEMTGMSIIPGIKAVKGAPKKLVGLLGLTKETAAKKALRRFQKEVSGTIATQPQISKNIKIAKDLERKIQKETGVDFKFTQGQITNDASAISLERTLSRKGGQDLSQSQRELANETLRKYYAKKVAGTADPAAFATRVDKLRRGLVSASSEAENAVTIEVEKLGQSFDEQKMGKSIHKFLTKGKQVARDQANKLYNQIPDAKLSSTNLNEGIDDLVITEDNIIESNTQKMINLVRSKIGSAEEPKVVGYQVLRKLKSRIGKNIRNASSGVTPNLEDARQLEDLQRLIDDAMTQIDEVSPEISKTYRKAQSFYKEEYIPRFRQGTVADVLQRGQRGEESKVALANIAKQFDSLDGIDDFIRAVGDDNVAKQAMKDYYSFNFLGKMKGEITEKKAQSWLANNAQKLKKLGIHDDFKNIEGLQRIFEEKSELLNIYNKSVASKLLDVDLDSMISSAFKGSKNFKVTAQDLMALAKGDEAAEEGLKRAFADHIFKNAETTAPDFFQAGETLSEIAFNKSLAKLTKQIQKFSPALKEIYKNDKAKAEALNDVWKGYSILGRTAKSPAGGGSDTFELFGKTLDIVAGSTAPGKWYAFKTVRDMVNKFGSANTEIYLRKVMFDPDYAKTLTDISRGGPSPERSRAIERFMTMIIQGATRETPKVEVESPTARPQKRNILQSLANVPQQPQGEPEQPVFGNRRTINRLGDTLSSTKVIGQ